MAAAGVLALGQVIIRFSDGRKVEIAKDSGAVILLDDKGNVKVELPRTTNLDEGWQKYVASLSPAKQAEAVIAELRKRNKAFVEKPAFLNVTAKEVQGLGFITDHITDLTLVAALPKLRRFMCKGTAPHKGAIAVLSPLAGLPLESVDLYYNPQIVDLQPLRGKAIQELRIYDTGVTGLDVVATLPLREPSVGGNELRDLSPLKGLALRSLHCNDTLVADLTPLQGMPLEQLRCAATQVYDLAPIANLPLRDLQIQFTHVRDLKPLAEMNSLEFLDIHDTAVDDLSPLLGLHVTKLVATVVLSRDRDILRKLDGLEQLNGVAVDDYLRKFEKRNTKSDSGKPAHPISEKNSKCGRPTRITSRPGRRPSRLGRLLPRHRHRTINSLATISASCLS